MSDLSSWEQKNIEILTSKEMGEWLERREKRMPVVPVSVLEKIREEIDQEKNETYKMLGYTLGFDKIAAYDKCLGIIDRVIAKEHTK